MWPFKQKNQKTNTEIKKHESEIELIDAARLIRDLLLSDNNGIIGELSRVLPGFRTKKGKTLAFNASLHLSTAYKRIGLGDNDFKLTVMNSHRTNVTSCNRAKFLKLVIIEFNLGDYIQPITVHELIKFFANKLGSVHLDYRKTGGPNDLLHNLWEHSNGINLPYISRLMIGISEIVLSSCVLIEEKLVKLGY
jgi:hypothetical protein